MKKKKANISAFFALQSTMSKEFSYFIGVYTAIFFKTPVARPMPRPRGLYFAPRVAPRTNALRAAQHLNSDRYHRPIQFLASDNLTCQSRILLQVENNIKNIFLIF